MPGAPRLSEHTAARLTLPRLPSGLPLDGSLDALWRAHDTALAQYAPGAAGGLSLLQLKAEIARQMLRQCVFCERRCGADRAAQPGGACGLGSESRLFFAGLLVTEEAEISPSFSLFPAGCNFSCVFCCVGDDNAHPRRGEPLRADALDRWLAAPENASARTISFIGGEPTVHLHAVLAALAQLESPLPVAWNSNFYFSQETARLLEGVVDFYIADCHYGSDHCAQRLAGVEHHFAVVTRNLLWAAQRARLMLRHLVLPGHFDCCTRPVLAWAAQNLEAPLHLMCNYVPPRRGAPDELGRALAPHEIRQALECANDLRVNLLAVASPVSASLKS